MYRGIEKDTFQQRCSWATRNIKLAITKELESLKEETSMHPDSVNVEVMQRKLIGEPTEFMVSNVNLTFKI